MRLRKILIATLAALVFYARPLQGRDKSDVIVMKNGDKITCEVKGLSSNTLYISVDYILNTLSVDWTKVDHIDSKQLFLVRTQGGVVYTGVLSSPEAPDRRPVELVVREAPEKTVTLKRTEVINVDETSRSFWERWYGSLGSGFTYTKGNETAQYNLNSDLGYGTERWSAGATYNSVLTTSTGVTTSTRNQISVSAQRLLRWNNWYYTGLANFLQSSVQGIQLQETFGGGIGKNIVNSGGTLFSVYGGFAWQQINYQQTVVAAQTQQVTFALIGTDFKIFRFNRTNLDLTANFMPALSDPGRVQFNANVSYYVKLFGKLNWNFTFYANVDNRPPPGFAQSDYGASSGLSISFGTPIHL